MSNQDSPTNRPSGSSYPHELMKELESLMNIYESNNISKFPNAQMLLMREIQRVLDAEVLNSLGMTSGTPRGDAGRETGMFSIELSRNGNRWKEDSKFMTSAPISESSKFRQSFSPLTLSLIGGGGSSSHSEEDEGKIEKSDKLYFPDGTKNNANPIGRLIGPRGITIRQLEKDLGCKLFIRGKGCTRDDAREERLRGRSGWEHLDEPIHVVITIKADTEYNALEKIMHVKQQLQGFLENTDSELKRSQLMQLAVIEGTLK